MHTEGSIPLRSAIAHPITSLCSLSMVINWSSWSDVRVEAMITGRVSLGPRKEYFKFSGRGFNSSYSGASKDETRRFG